jgi:hypothetical protein
VQPRERGLELITEGRHHSVEPTRIYNRACSCCGGSLAPSDFEGRQRSVPLSFSLLGFVLSRAPFAGASRQSPEHLTRAPQQLFVLDRRLRRRRIGYRHDARLGLLDCLWQR